MEKLAGAMSTIETQVLTLENASVSIEAMKAMREGANSMKGIHNEMNIDQVDNTMEDIREQMDVANEISEAISQPIGGEIMDDDDLLAELEQLEQEGLDEQLLSVPTPQKLPNAPTKAPAKQQIDEEAELAALEASMAS